MRVGKESENEWKKGCTNEWMKIKEQDRRNMRQGTKHSWMSL